MWQIGDEMKIGVIRFPGTNCDRDVAKAIELAGLTPEYIWWSEEKLTDYDGIVNTDVDEWNAGKGLKESAYKLDLTQNIKDVYFNITKKNATTGTNFGRAFAGSGKGIKFDSNHLEHILSDWASRQGGAH